MKLIHQQKHDHTNSVSSYDHQVAALVPAASLVNISRLALRDSAAGRLADNFANHSADSVTRIIISRQSVDAVHYGKNRTDVFTWRMVFDDSTWSALHCLLAVLFLSDLLLLWHRAKRLRHTVQTLRNGVRETIFVTPSAAERTSNAANRQRCGPDVFVPLLGGDGPPMTTDDALPLYKLLMTEIAKSARFKIADRDASDDGRRADDKTGVEEEADQSAEADGSRSCLKALYKALQCPLVTSVVIACVLMLSCYALAEFATRSVTVDVVVGPGRGAYDANGQSSNQSDFLGQVAAESSQFLSLWYKRVVDTDLLQLKAFVDYFNTSKRSECYNDKNDNG